MKERFNTKFVIDTRCGLSYVNCVFREENNG